MWDQSDSYFPAFLFPHCLLPPSVNHKQKPDDCFSNGYFTVFRYGISAVFQKLRNVLKTYNSYQFGNIIIPYPEMIFIVYTASTLLCLLCTGTGFQKHQVKN